MNCQDISRALDSRDVNTLSDAERRACEAHAASCPHCGPEWVVYSRLAAIPAPVMPQKFAARCEALVAVHLKDAAARRSSSLKILLGTIFAVTAAAAALIAGLTSPSIKSRAQISVSEPTVQIATPTATIPEAAAPEAELAPNGVPVPPVAVFIELTQATDDAAGRAFGRQVYDRVKEELRTLVGVVVVDADSASAATPAFRVALLNATKLGGSFTVGPDGIPIASAPTGDQPLLFNVFLQFRFEALQPGANGANSDQPVLRYGMATFVSPECLGRRAAGGCGGPTASELATFGVLSWRLATTAPDHAVEARLHAMLLDSSEQFLRRMAFSVLTKYKMLRMDDLRATVDLIAADSRNPTLRAEWLAALIASGNGSEVMNEARDLLLRQLPNGDRPAGIAVRESLVTLLATDLRNEAAARATLESVADSDPSLDVRAEAKRALGTE